MEMCYRGVKYNYNPVILDKARTQTIQTKFLGRVCQKETIASFCCREEDQIFGTSLLYNCLINYRKCYESLGKQRDGEIGRMI